MKDSGHSFKKHSFYSRSSIPTNSSNTNDMNSSKLRALQDKWDFLESQDVHFSQKRRLFLESFIIDLENNFFKGSEEAEGLFKKTEEDLCALHEAFIGEKKGYFVQNEKEKNLLNGLEDNYFEILSDDNERYRDYFEKIREEFEEKMFIIRTRLIENENERLGMNERIVNRSEGILIGLKEKLGIERSNRELKEKQMIESFGKEVDEVFLGLELERRIREETNKKMMDMIKGMGDCLFRDIEVGLFKIFRGKTLCDIYF